MAKLGNLTRYDPSHLSRFERGERWPPEDVARSCDRALDAQGALLRLWRLADEEQDNPDIPQRHVANPMVDVASGQRNLVDGTPRQAPSEVDEGIVVPCRDLSGRIVWVSIPRRTFLLGGVTAATGVLASSKGPPRGRGLAKICDLDTADYANTIEQFRNLRAVLVDSDNLLGPRHIISTVEEHIQLISQLRDTRSGSDRLGLLDMQARYAEFAGWLHQDLGDFGKARSWLDRALEWSHAVGDQDMATYVLARKSQLAGDMHDAAAAVDMANAAMRMALPRSRLAAVASTYAAHGHALRGENRETLGALDDARARLDQVDDDSAAQWASWLNAQYIDVQRARCLEILGDHGQAAGIFQQAIEGLPPTYRRDRGVYLAREALAHARAGEPTYAAVVGMSALGIATETGSGRIVTELLTLDTELASQRTVREAADFRAALTEIIPRQIAHREGP